MITTSSFISNSRGTLAGILHPNRMQKYSHRPKAGRVHQGTW